MSPIQHTTQHIRQMGGNPHEDLAFCFVDFNTLDIVSGGVGVNNGCSSSALFAAGAVGGAVEASQTLTSII